jgi:hypothetical protein
MREHIKIKALSKSWGYCGAKAKGREKVLEIRAGCGLKKIFSS